MSEEHIQQALQSTVLQEALHVLEPDLRRAVMPALTAVIREARHDERRLCAKIALAEAGAAPDGACQAAAERIAATILARDAEDE
jgi:hypothetical protein